MFHQCRTVLEVFSGRHPVDLPQGFGLDIDGRVDPLLDSAWRFAPIRQQRDPVTILNLVNRLVVLYAVRLGAADNPNIRRRRVDISSKPYKVRSQPRTRLETLGCLDYPHACVPRRFQAC